MYCAAHFAVASASLVEAHETAGLIETLFARSLDAAVKGEGGREVREWVKRVRSAPEHKDLLQLAVSLRDIASRGDAERQLCRDILDAISRWTEKHSTISTGYFSF